MILDILAGVCLIGGALLSVAAGIGLLRFPDVLSRIHTGTKPQVLGLVLILFAVAIRLRSLVDLPMLVLIVVFQMATAPVAAHMIARAAYRTGVIRHELLIVDELAGNPPSDQDRSEQSH